MPIPLIRNVDSGRARPPESMYGGAWQAFHAEAGMRWRGVRTARGLATPTHELSAPPGGLERSDVPGAIAREPLNRSRRQFDLSEE